MIIMKRRLSAILIVLLLILPFTFTSCNNNSSDPNTSSGNNAKISENPFVLFGEEVKSSGITYTIEGAESLTVGNILEREYFKIDKKDVILNFKLDDKYAEKFSGKPLFLILEYYESNSRDYTLSYSSKSGVNPQNFNMSGANLWGGKSVRIDDFERNSSVGYDFSLKLADSNQLWIRSLKIAEASGEQSKYPQMITTQYENSNGAVISANVKDFGALGNGTDDDSVAFQSAVSSIAEGGGAVYVPAGTYKLSQEMSLPSGVSLIGDFKEPTEKDPTAGGTILALTPVSSEKGNTNEFFQMQAGSSINGFTLWYPEQTMKDGSAVEYPYTICNTQASATIIENVNMVNVYNGINHNKLPNQQQTTINIYGTPLFNGVKVGQVNDSGRDEKLDFAPDWWLKSGLPGIPDEAVLKNWLLKYGTAFYIVHIDWHFLADLTVKGYNIGLRIDSFFGRAYNLNITDCNTCLYAEAAAIYGGQLTNAVLKANGGENPVAMRLGEDVANGVSCNSVVFESTGAKAIEHLGTGPLSIQDCTVKLTGSSGESGLYNKQGRVSVINTTFDGGEKHIKMDEGEGDISVTNCTAGGKELVCDAKNPKNLSIVNDPANKTVSLNLEELKSRDALRVRQNRHAEKNQLFIASDYGVKPGTEDISKALQSVIDAAAEAGGGTVYVPKGEYRLEAPVTVKSGVELLGSTDYFHYINAASTFFITDYGKGKEKDAALITLLENSGARGFSVSYDKVRQETIQPYAPTIQGKGSNIYLMNVAVASAWYVADFNTYRCDNHYIDSVVFAAFKTGIAVGGGSENGVVRYGHSNSAIAWDNPFTDRANWSTEWTGPLNVNQITNVTGFYFGKTKNQTMFFSLIFGSLNGIWADDGADLYVIGHGTDYSTHGMYVSGNSNVFIIDPQLSGAPNSNAFLADASFTGTASVFNPAGWAIRDTAVKVLGGTVNINGGVFLECGKAGLLADGGNTTMSGVITVIRSLADIQATSKAKSICAFGNLPMKTPRFEVASGVNKSGSDIVKK